MREYFTIPEAVERWPLLTYRILRAACVASSKGKGPTIGRKLGNKWLVTSEEVERLIEHGTADKQDKGKDIGEWDTGFTKGASITTPQSQLKVRGASHHAALELPTARGLKSTRGNGSKAPGGK
jgi:hypothetical protein